VTWVFDVTAAEPIGEADEPAEGSAGDPATETETVRAARLGQAKFRQDLMDRWDRRCAVTGLPLPALLRASHIKPWRHSTDRERLDPENGLLLAVHIDGLFDRGLISFADDGAIIPSPMLSAELVRALGLDDLGPIKNLTPRTREYLAVHRDRYLKRPQTEI
jgi:putative restriction endonuclease